MSQPTPLPPELIGQLKAEAHATLCRQSCEQALEGVERERQKLQGTRPVFAFLSSSKTKATIESTEQELDQTERQVQERLELIDRIDIWVMSVIRPGLETYLTQASAEYQTLERLRVIVARWQRGISQLSECVLAVARELRALSDPNRSTPAVSSLALLSPLRAAVLSVQTCKSEVNAAAEEFAQLKQGRLNEKVNLPALPRLPELAWVDRMIVKGLAEMSDQLAPAEATCREFCRTTVRALLNEAQPIDPQCVAAKTLYLEHYWKQLRAHSIQHLGGKVDPATVLADLEKRMVWDQQTRQQEALTRSPFAFPGR